MVVTCIGKDGGEWGGKVILRFLWGFGDIWDIFD